MAKSCEAILFVLVVIGAVCGVLVVARVDLILGYGMEGDVTAIRALKEPGCD